MTVKQLTEALKLEVICMPEPEREITGGYTGDLLSWVMGRARAGNAWITIMTNVNIVAVATLAEPACIVLAEGVLPDKETVEKAVSVGVNILKSPRSSFELCADISGIL